MADLLLLNDLPVQNLWWQQVLMQSGHQLRSCTTLLAARRSVRRKPPDLLLLELQQWQSNGFSLAAALPLPSGTPVVLLCVREQDSDLLWARTRGIDLVLALPQSPALLCRSINELLAARGVA